MAKHSKAELPYTAEGLITELADALEEARRCQKCGGRCWVVVPTQENPRKGERIQCTRCGGSGCDR